MRLPTLPLALAMGLAACLPVAAHDDKGAGHAAGHDGMVTVPGEAAVQWAPAPANLPKGMDLVVIHGDPAKPGPFTLRVRMPPNTLIAPHTHAKDESLTVISGAFTHDTGEKVDKARGVAVGKGGFVYLPAKMPHALWTEGETAVLQVTGTGPFGVDYVDPADDPSRKAEKE